MTQKDLLESLLTEIGHIKTHMPNGELQQMQKDLERLRADLSEMKHTLLNPDNGVIVNTNKNTDFRRLHEANSEKYAKQTLDVEELKGWKNNVGKALWIIFGILGSILLKFLLEIKG